MDIAGTGLLLTGVAWAASTALDRYRPTIHGANPWTLEAVFNVLVYSQWIERAATLVGANLESVYRSARVNQLVGGVSNSDHLYGRAVDLTPRAPVRDVRAWVEAAVVTLKAAADRGELGPVRQILIERGGVHVGWYPLSQGGARPATVGTWGI